MSYRHTFITEYLYMFPKEAELAAIQESLEEYGDVSWHGNNSGTGYFHGVIKDLDGHQTKSQEEEIAIHMLQKHGVRIRIILE